jgi:hypothetical protein
MENYSFLKYVKIKEQEIKKRLKYLENQIGGDDTVDLKTVQIELLKLKKKLHAIQSKKVDTLIDPYDKLKTLIDGINSSIQRLEGELTILTDDTAEQKKMDILNKIKELEVTLDTSPNDYTKIQANSKVSYVGEKINPEEIDKIFKVYVKDSEQMIADIRTKIGGAGGKLIKNEEILSIIKSVRAKMEEYETNLANFVELEKTLKGYINEMEKIFLVKIDETMACMKPGDNAIIINVDKISGEGKTLEDTDDALKVAESPEQIAELISATFLKKPKIEESGEETPEPIPTTASKETGANEETGAARKYLKVKNKYSKEFPKDKLVVTNTEIDENILKLHQEWLKKVKEYKASLELKATKIKEILRNQNKLMLLNSFISELPKTLFTEFPKLQELADDIVKRLEYYTNIQKPEEISKSEEIISLPSGYGIDILNDIKSSIESKLLAIFSEFTNWMTQGIFYKEQIEDILVAKFVAINNINPFYLQNIAYKIKQPFNVKDIKANIIKYTKTFIEKSGIATLPGQIKTLRAEIGSLMKFYNLLNPEATQMFILKNKLKDFIKENSSFSTDNKYLLIGGREKPLGGDGKVAEGDDAEGEGKVPEGEGKVPEGDDAVPEGNDTRSRPDPGLSETDTPYEVEETASEANLLALIAELEKYEKLVRDIKRLNITLNKLVKLYNIRYSQFFNFQKYIVNYVSLRIAEGGYSYYQYMSKGAISFFDSLLTDLGNILDKFNKYSNLDESDYAILKQSHIRWFYGKHYFMVKILQNFFSELYKFWSEKESASKEWTLDKQLKTDTTKNSIHFFLFNIFQEILMEYYMKLPSIANYIRINQIRSEDDMLNTFNKNTKNYLSKEDLKKCIQNGADGTAEEISKIKFAEIFDPDNFKENDSIPYYMGLSEFLNKGKSIMILTYGYSGVGKSFTLFGSPEKTNPDTGIKTGPTQGMLQSTLKRLGSGIKIKVKMFELYGLGVPYKFYWKNPKKFCHFIYEYKFESDTLMRHNRKEREEFENYLNINDDSNYNILENKHIDNFTNFIDSIDKIRKNEGRIKSTLNNPESSRSIMIYDFKIDLKEPIEIEENGAKIMKKFTNFVVMDLPGKEDIFQTYCNSKDPKFELSSAFRKMMKVGVKGVTKTPSSINVTKTQTSDEYDNVLLRSMMYINPLWLSMVPEIAEKFELDTLNIDNLFKEQPTQNNVDIHMILTTGIVDISKCTHKINQEPLFSEYVKAAKEKEMDIKKINCGTETAPMNKDVFNTVFSKMKQSILHEQFQFFKNEDNTNKTNTTVNLDELTYLRLLGLSERALHNIVNIIDSGDLEKLGEKLNSMLESEDAKKHNYGFAGLEGIYINENILGLLQVLADRVRDIKKKPHVPVVCAQKENYKRIISQNKKLIPLDPAIKNESKTFLQDDEFYCQIEFLNEFEHINYPRNSPINMEDVYDNKIRNVKDNNSDPKYYGKKYIEWIKNYDYNNIFNIEDPPIKKVLEPYVNSIDNFYLFFVVSNNKKQNPSSKAFDIETCDKQMKLLYDTRDFMKVVAEDDPPGVTCKI